MTDQSPPLLCAVALVVAAAGGLLPFTPIEPMLIGIAAVTPPSLLIVVIVVATAGQMASKWALYAGSCRAVDALRPDRRVAVDKAMARLSGTRRRQLLTVFLSAAAGLPPFYVVTVAWGVARLRLTDFVIAGRIGRAARFTVIMLPPNLYLDALPCGGQPRRRAAGMEDRAQRGQEPGKKNPPNTCSVATIKIAVRLTV